MDAQPELSSIFLCSTPNMPSIWLYPFSLYYRHTPRGNMCSLSTVRHKKSHQMSIYNKMMLLVLNFMHKQVSSWDVWGGDIKCHCWDKKCPVSISRFIWIWHKSISMFHQSMHRASLSRQWLVLQEWWSVTTPHFCGVLLAHDTHSFLKAFITMYLSLKHTIMFSTNCELLGIRHQVLFLLKTF